MTKKNLEEIFSGKIPMPVCVVDANGKIAGVSPKIRDVFLKEWELSTKSAYFILALSIISEQAGTACLEASDGYRIASFSILTAILGAPFFIALMRRKGGWRL